METIENISLDLIDDPEVAMRTTLDEDKLHELSQSIKSHGLIQPITLRKRGERYEVVAGHRRTLASRFAGIATIPAIVRDLDDQQSDEMKVHENLFREDVNPVDEGRFIVKMIDVHGKSPQEMAEMTGKSESYVRSRYDLLQYPDYLIEAVEAEDVSLSAAQWLVRIDDDRVRQDYTRFAKLGGITARRAEGWYRSWSSGILPRDPETFEDVPAQPAAEPVPIMECCTVCQHMDDIMRMQMRYVHTECEKVMKEVALAKRAPASEASQTFERSDETARA